jgi:Mrp family chromosome partitioning ATPase
MITKQQITDELNAIIIPGAMRSPVQMNLVRDISTYERTVKINIANTALTPGVQESLKSQIVRMMKKFKEIEETQIDFVEAKPADLNEIKNVIAVMSGKGGVGKSAVSSLVSVALRRKGFDVGILDADITGPSVPRMFGITDRPTGSDNGFLPVPSRTGIQVMSINLLLPNEDDAVIWRGPLIASTIKQFWEEVLWGKLDYLIVDLPPGTADAPLTVLQTLPVSGIIMVFTPQDLTAMVVRKAVNMARKMNKPILGVIENMSYFYVPEIDKKIEIFGKSRADEMARSADAPLLGQLPIDPDLARLCDAGGIERYNNELIDILGEALSNMKAGCGSGGTCCGREERCETPGCGGGAGACGCH